MEPHCLYGQDERHASSGNERTADQTGLCTITTAADDVVFDTELIVVEVKDESICAAESPS